MGKNRPSQSGEHSRQRDKVEADSYRILAGYRDYPGYDCCSERQPKLEAAQAYRCPTTSLRPGFVETCHLAADTCLDVLVGSDIGRRSSTRRSGNRLINQIVDVAFDPLALFVEPLRTMRGVIVGGGPRRELEGFALEAF